MSEFPHAVNANESIDALDRLDELVSLLLDDALEPDGLGEIEQLLERDSEALRRYLDMAQLHVELTQYFRQSNAGATTRQAEALLGVIDLSNELGDSFVTPSEGAAG